MCQTARKQGLTGMLYSGGKPAKGIFSLLRSPLKIRKSIGSLLMRRSITLFLTEALDLYHIVYAVQLSMLLAFSLQINNCDKEFV